MKIGGVLQREQSSKNRLYSHSRSWYDESVVEMTARPHRRFCEQAQKKTVCEACFADYFHLQKSR